MTDRTVKPEESMKGIKRIVTVGLAALLITSWSVPCFAGDSPFKEIFEDAFYGGLAGTLVGAAFMAFTNRPEDHLDYMAYGAASGVLVGATYGLVKSTRALAELENGRIKLAMPTILPDVHESGGRGSSSLMLKAELIRGKF
jgi:hypothetical protein